MQLIVKNFVPLKDVCTEREPLTVIGSQAARKSVLAKLCWLFLTIEIASSNKTWKNS
jgi:hypothetical protein